MSKHFSTLFLQHYPDRTGIVKYVQKAVGKEDVLLSDLTKVNMKKIKDTILENVAANTAKTYFSLIKAFVNLYSDQHKIPCTDTKLLRAKRQPSQNVYLTETEIEQIENYLARIENTDSTKKVKRQTEIDVLHAFLAECYCGARGCDIQTFNEENFKDGYLSYVSKKTKVVSKLPIHKNLMRHINYKPAKTHRQAVLDRVLKRVCEHLGFNEQKTLFYHGKLQTLPKYEFVGFHTARRSFATNLHLRNVTMGLIAQMMNHGTDLQMTQRYIVVDANSLDDNALAFFN